MSFKKILTDTLYNRLEKNPLLLVYDPARRYREIIRSMESDRMRIVEAGESTLEARKNAAEGLERMQENRDLSMLIYAPYESREEIHSLKEDPLAGFAAIGGRFPDPANQNEQYKSLAHLAFPEYGEKIDELFAAGPPSVKALEALGGGDSYPVLQSTFSSASAAEIIISILTEKKERIEELLADETGRAEIEQLLSSNIGVEVSDCLGELESLRERIWRYLLFSEFTLDLPAELPASLKSIPSAGPMHSRPVFHICGKLRDSTSTRQVYIDMAEKVEEELSLAEKMRGVYDLGEIDTFSFENASSMKSAVDAVSAGRLEEAETLTKRAETSVWFSEDSLLSQSWRIIGLALGLLRSIEKAETMLTERGKGAITDYYLRFGVEADRAFREFTQSFKGLFDEEPYGVDLTPLEEIVAERYRGWTSELTTAAVEQFRTESRPLDALPSQAQIFEKNVRPHLEENRRVAYFLIDSLRYELAERLEENLKRDHSIDLEAAAALIPSKTALGMAALTPPMDSPLSLQAGEGGFSVFRGERKLSSAEERDKWFKSFRGDRCAVMPMEKWLRYKKKLDETVDLLVVRHREIDEAGHSSQTTHSSFGSILNDIAKGIRKSFSRGFEVAVVATDHGFLFLPESKPGDKVSPPGGHTVYRQDRYAFGAFEKSPHHYLLETELLDYETNVKHVAVPASIGAYEEPSHYMHGGLSLQESLIPVMTIRKIGTGRAKKEQVELSYRSKSSAPARTRTPSVTVSVPAESRGLGFEESWAEDTVDILITVRDEEGTSVGSVSPNDFLDPSSGILRIPRGSSHKIPVALEEEFNGTCIIRAHNPVTMESYGEVRLDIDILE